MVLTDERGPSEPDDGAPVARDAEVDPLPLADPTGSEEALPGVKHGTSAARFTAASLQSELLAFADRYLEALAEAADRAAEASPGPAERAGFKQTKVVYVTAAITTVTEPDPLRVLRDLLVLLRLQRIVWEGQKHPWAAPDNAARMALAVARLEKQVTELAGLILDAQAIADIHELTRRWHAANPERRYVAFVRFHDLEDSPLKQRFTSHLGRRGLLAPVREATAEIEQIRRVSERALFLANHLPMLLEWQAEAYLHGALELPEVRALSGNFEHLTGTAAELSASLKALPDDIAHERAAALGELASLVRRERGEALTQIAGILRAERAGLVTDLGDSTTRLGPLAEHLSTISTNLREALEVFAALRGAADDTAFDLAAFDGTVAGLTRLAGDTTTLVQALRDTLAAGDHATAGVDRLDSLLRAHERRLFGYALGVSMVLGLCLLGAAWLVRGRPRA